MVAPTPRSAESRRLRWNAAGSTSNTSDNTARTSATDKGALGLTKGDILGPFPPFNQCIVKFLSHGPEQLPPDAEGRLLQGLPKLLIALRQARFDILPVTPQNTHRPNLDEEGKKRVGPFDSNTPTRPL